MPSEGKYCKLHFYVVAQTEFGQSVYVSGPGSTFVNGNYKPSKAIPLHTTPTDYPVWKTNKPILIPRGLVHTYQYAVFNGQTIQAWEDIPARTVNCNNEVVKVEDEYNLSKKEQSYRLKAFSSSGNLSCSAGMLSMMSSVEEDSNNLNEEEDVHNDETLKNLALKYNKEARSIVDATSLSTIIGGRSLILACFHLPIEITKSSSGGWKVKWNDSLIARSDHSVADDTQTFWIGTVNVGRDRILTEADKMSIRNVLQEIKCIPIFAPQELIDRAYLGYCKQQLWPSFHNVDLLDLTHACWNGDASISNPELSWDQSSVQGHWDAYLELNEIFTKEYIKFSNDKIKSPKGSVLWVHDYHLMLVPKMVAKYEVENFGLRNSKIVFFLHIPFSTSQIFRSIQHGGELLEGMVHADAIGFHAFDHARHFLNACKRNLGLKFHTRVGGLLGVEYEGRTVSVLTRHVSIETAKVDREIIENNSQEYCNLLLKKHNGDNDDDGEDGDEGINNKNKKKKKKKKLIAGLDTCQRLSGVALKLLGFEKLLDEYEKWRNEVVLVQKVLRPRNRLDDEERTSIELQRLVARINFKYPGSVDYEEFDGFSTLPAGQRHGLWLACDVMLNTAVRESLNLDCLEYIYVKKNPGVLVASEFGSTVSVLSGALRINPFDLDSWKILLDESLRMSLSERQARKFRDIEYVTLRPSPVWTKQIINDMMSTTEDNFDEDTFIFSEENENGEGTGEKFQTNTKAFSKLSNKNVIQAYKETNRRLFVFDYAGTLKERERVNKFIKNDDLNITKRNNNDLRKDVLEYLKILSEDVNNTVYVISELGIDYMEDTFRDLPYVGLAARDGLCYCLASHPDKELYENNLNDMDDMDNNDNMDNGNITSSSSSPHGNESEGGRSRTRTSSLGSLLDMTMESSPTTSRPLPSPPSNSLLKASSNNSLVSQGMMSDTQEEDSHGRDWYTPDLGVDWPTIKSIALPLLNRYTGRTNGSSIRFREPSLAWSYYRADPDEGLMQATQLKQELMDALAPFNVLIQHNVGELDIIPKNLHQGAFMKHVMQITSETNGGLIPDFILVAGDSASDERMFSSVLQFVAAQFKPPSPSRLYVSAAHLSLSLENNNENEGDAASSDEDTDDAARFNGSDDNAMRDDDDDEDDDDYENPLSVAAEQMLDVSTPCIHSATEEIINQATRQQEEKQQRLEQEQIPFPSVMGQATNNLPLLSQRLGMPRAEAFFGGSEAVDSRVFTCTVGKKASCAGSYMESVRDVEVLLKSLSEAVLN